MKSNRFLILLGLAMSLSLVSCDQVKEKSKEAGESVKEGR